VLRPAVLAGPTARAFSSAVPTVCRVCGYGLQRRCLVAVEGSAPNRGYVWEHASCSARPSARPVCRKCGEGPNRHGALVRCHWSTSAGEYVWEHRLCESTRLAQTRRRVA
jgi:hypothetical protein